MPSLGVAELLIILAIILLLFGAKKLPELAKSMGEGVRELRRGLSGDTAKPDDSSKSKTN